MTAILSPAGDSRRRRPRCLLATQLRPPRPRSRSRRGRREERVPEGRGGVRREARCMEGVHERAGSAQAGGVRGAVEAGGVWGAAQAGGACVHQLGEEGWRDAGA